MRSYLVLFILLSLGAFASGERICMPFQDNNLNNDIKALNSEITIRADCEQFCSDICQIKTSKENKTEQKKIHLLFLKRGIIATAEEALTGNPETQANLSLFYDTLADFNHSTKQLAYKNQAFFWATKAAEKDEPQAQIILSQLYFSGIKGKLKASQSMSQMYLDKALAHNDSEINMLIISSALISDDVFPMDFQSAVTLLKQEQAKENKSAFSLSLLSTFYGDNFEEVFLDDITPISKKRIKQFRKEIPVDLILADQFEYELAIINGDERPYLALAQLYFMGYMLKDYEVDNLFFYESTRKPDIKRACYWLEKSIKNHEQEAQLWFDKINCP